MIKLGTNGIGKVYLGTNAIGKAYLGSDLVFQSGESPTPPTPAPIFYDYLVFDGAAYIDTGVIPPYNASFAIPFSNDAKKAQRLFMCLCSNTTNMGAILNSSTSTSQRTFSIYYGTYNNLSSDKSLSYSYSAFSFFLTPKRFGWGDTAHAFSNGGDETPVGGLILGSQTGHTGTPYNGRMGMVRIYGSDAQNATSYSGLVGNYTPVATLRPCTYNGEAGMWCVETSTFYGNTAGSGTLTVQNI